MAKNPIARIERTPREPLRVRTPDLSRQLSESSDGSNLAGGVTVTYLVKAFRMGRAHVERALMNCRVIGTTTSGANLYDLPEAASYLVKPKTDLQKLVASMKPEELPDHLKESYWNALLKQQRYEEKAGDTWSTDKVIEVFAGTLGVVRTRLQILPDQVERLAGLTPAQVKILSSQMDAIQDGVHKEIIKFSKRHSTPNRLGELRLAAADEVLMGVTARDDGDLI